MAHQGLDLSPALSILVPETIRVLCKSFLKVLGELVGIIAEDLGVIGLRHKVALLGTWDSRSKLTGQEVLARVFGFVVLDKVGILF